MRTKAMLCGLFLTGWCIAATAGDIDGAAVLGGAIGDGAGAEVGSAGGGREGAVVGAGLGGAPGAMIATRPDPQPKATVKRQPLVVERESRYVPEFNCGPRGH
jgi:hypothetical protein